MFPSVSLPAAPDFSTDGYDVVDSQYCSTTFTPSAANVHLVRFRLPAARRITDIEFEWGAVSANNVCVGIADTADHVTWNRQATSGSVAASGVASTIQRVPLLVAFNADRGVEYWAAFELDVVTSSPVIKRATGTIPGNLAGYKSMSRSTTFPIPATLTPLIGNASTPWMRLIFG